MARRLAGSRCSMLIHTLGPVLYIEILHLPQAVLSLCCDGSVGQGDPELAVFALLLDLVGDAHPCLFFLEEESEACDCQ